MLAYYNHAQPVDSEELLTAAKAAGMTPAQLRGVMYELPHANGQQKRNVDPCPLSSREVEVLSRLAEGKVYKQIAQELDLSTSTVRTHRARLGLADRAAAVQAEDQVREDDPDHETTEDPDPSGELEPAGSSGAESREQEGPADQHHVGGAPDVRVAHVGVVAGQLGTASPVARSAQHVTARDAGYDP
jgi:DNA-binding CsgD family transcriptional regulator